MDICTLTEGQIKHASGSTSANAQKFAPYIRLTCEKYQIDTPARQLCFLAQLGHESGGLFYTEELANGSAYEGRKALGNIVAGDGVRFKGRGLIQITGRHNYKAVGLAFGIDLLKNPTLLGGKNVNTCTPEQLKNAALSAGWYWNSRNLNLIADKINLKLAIDGKTNLVFYEAITRKINGGVNGFGDRISKFKGGLQFFV